MRLIFKRIFSIPFQLSTVFGAGYENRSGVPLSPTLQRTHDPGSRFRLLAKHRSAFRFSPRCAQAQHYPAQYRFAFCAGYENRTRIYCLGSSRSTTKLIPHCARAHQIPHARNRIVLATVSSAETNPARIEFYPKTPPQARCGPVCLKRTSRSTSQNVLETK